MHRRTLALLIALAAAGCGGGAASPPAGGDPVAPRPALPPPPGTPPAAPADPGAPAVGGSGSNRFQIGAAMGLYLVDPAAGEPSVQGFVVVTLGPVGTGNFIPPADTVVTMNGVPLLRDPSLNGAYWRVAPSGPQPAIGSGGRMVLTASGTVSGAPVQRTLVLPCPSDVAVASSPPAGSALAQGGPLHITSAADITLNVGVPAMASIFPAATILGYDPATRALTGASPAQLIGPGPLDVTLAVPSTAAPAYLVDLRWPGTWIVDGETGGFCGLAKRWTYGR